MMIELLGDFPKSVSSMGKFAGDYFNRKVGQTSSVKSQGSGVRGQGSGVKTMTGQLHADCE